MKVKELIELLGKFDPEMEVWSSADDEMNRINKLGYSPTVFYIDKDEKWGTDEVYQEEDFEELQMNEEDIKNLKKVVVL